MKPLIYAGLIVTLLCVSFSKDVVVAQSDAGQNPQPATPLRTHVKKEELVAQLERSIPQLMKDGEVPGLAIALIRDSKILWQRGFGVKSVETREPVDEQTVFEAASLSKPVFAYAVLRMVDRGQLDLDTPLVKYLPGAYVENDPRLNLITARMVLSHRTGFPNWRPRGGPLRIHFTPGEKFSYSGEGFVFLQKVVERVTGQPLDEVMRKTVFEPLGMTSSSYVWLDSFDKRKATGHNPAGAANERRRPTEANAASSLQTTVGDYSRFLIAVMNGTGLKKESAKEMLRVQVSVDEGGSNAIERGTGRLSKEIAWGLGWGLEQTANGKAFWHWGSNNDDVKCFTVAYEKEKAGLVVFTNSGNGLSIVSEIVNQALGGSHPSFAWTRTDPYNSPARLLFKAIVTEGADAALKRYTEARKAYADAALSEAQINAIGYVLLQRKKVAQAIEVFKLNVADYPQSSNAYDSLAEAYMTGGDKELAITNYKRSVELNPGNTNAVEMLKKLEGK
ncbi:MAG TPA: serine hydrolase [Pyrinomonadaceae bacterium]|nr:serine hydrolase [Pyrinomonadaceae bacterium]